MRVDLGTRIELQDHVYKRSENNKTVLFVRLYSFDLRSYSILFSSVITPFPFYLSLFSLLLLLFLMVIKTVSFPITFRYHFYFVLIFSSLPFSLSFLFSLLSLSLFVDSFFVLLSPLLSLRWT